MESTSIPLEAEEEQKSTMTFSKPPEKMNTINRSLLKSAQQLRTGKTEDFTFNTTNNTKWNI